MMRKIDKFILHCAATKEGKHFTVEDIDAWHKARGFAATYKGETYHIGYHYVIYLDGSVHKGRPEEVIGAHVKGQNAYSIGICYIGGLDEDGNAKDTRTPEQREALYDLIDELHGRYPEATLHGHNEFAAKACPSFNVKTEL